MVHVYMVDSQNQQQPKNFPLHPLNISVSAHTQGVKQQNLYISMNNQVPSFPTKRHAMD